jgi:histidine triad (HIT) family protein
MANNTIPVPRVYENEHVFVIKDINPQAPTHLLAIPKAHYGAIHNVPEKEHALFHHLYTAIHDVVQKEGISEKGYRLVINSGSSAGQSVDHIHVHILSGRQMNWPPG